MKKKRDDDGVDLLTVVRWIAGIWCVGLVIYYFWLLSVS